jgi:hypothetical protein
MSRRLRWAGPNRGATPLAAGAPICSADVVEPGRLSPYGSEAKKKWQEAGCRDLDGSTTPHRVAVAGTALRVEGKLADAERPLFFKLCALVGAAAGSGLAARRCMAMHAPAVANAAAAAWQRRHI